MDFFFFLITGPCEAAVQVVAKENAIAGQVKSPDRVFCLPEK